MKYSVLDFSDLKLKYVKPLSNFAYNFNLRHYRVEGVDNVHSFDLTLRALTALG